MKLCKDCKWHRLSFINKIFSMDDFAECVRPELKQSTDETPVTGKLRTNYCRINRKYFCVDGKYFEEKN